MRSEDHSLPLNCGNVGLRRFEPLTSCMPCTTGQSATMGSPDRAAAAPRVRAAEARSRGGDGAAADLAERLGVGRRCRFAGLEALRAAHGVSVSRFAALAGIPERSYGRRLARHPAGDPPKGPWPAPGVDAIEAVAAKYAADGPAWGHRKIAAMMRADGHQVSTSTVQRALRRRGLLPAGSGQTADRGRGCGSGCSETHHAQRNRVGQIDFSEFETARGGIWRICAVIDYATKYCLAATVTPTSRGQDALGCLRRAVGRGRTGPRPRRPPCRPRRDGRRRRRRLRDSMKHPLRSPS
jgi:hypothetical protein